MTSSGPSTSPSTAPSSTASSPSSFPLSLSLPSSISPSSSPHPLTSQEDEEEGRHVEREESKVELPFFSADQSPVPSPIPSDDDPHPLLEPVFPIPRTSTPAPHPAQLRSSSPSLPYFNPESSDEADCPELAVDDTTTASSAPASPSSSTSSSSSLPASTSAVTLQLDDFTCCICLSLLLDPITLHCQHSMCRHCLVSCFELSAKRCPSCRSPADAGLSYEHLLPNTLLINILKAAFPSRYARREEMVRSIREGWKLKQAIYYTSELIFPYQSVLLNTHERRYQLLMQRLQQRRTGPRTFALLSSSTAVPAQGAVGVLCEVVGDCVSDSGAVQVNARSRCQVQSLWVEEGTHGLAFARVEPIEDVDESEPSSSSSSYAQQVADAVARIHQLIATHDALSPLSFHSKFGTVPPAPHQLSFWIFQALAVDAGGGHHWLAAGVMTSRSLLWRLNVGEDLLNESCTALLQQQRQQEGHRRRGTGGRSEARPSCPYPTFQVVSPLSSPHPPPLSLPPPGLYALPPSYSNEQMRGRAQALPAYQEEHKQPPPQSQAQQPPHSQHAQPLDWPPQWAPPRPPHARRSRHHQHQQAAHRQLPQRAPQSVQPPPPHPHWPSPPLVTHQQRAQAHAHLRSGNTHHSFHAYRPPSLHPPRSVPTLSMAPSPPPPLLSWVNSVPGSPPSPGLLLPPPATDFLPQQPQPAAAFRPYQLF